MDSSIALAPIARIPVPSRLSAPELKLRAPEPKFDRYLDGLRGAERRARSEPADSTNSDEVGESSIPENDELAETPESQTHLEQSTDQHPPVAPATDGKVPSPAVEVIDPSLAKQAASTPDASEALKRGQIAQQADSVAGTPVDIKIRPASDEAKIQSPGSAGDTKVGKTDSSEAAAPTAGPLTNKTAAAVAKVITPVRDVRPLPPEDTIPHRVRFGHHGLERRDSNPVADAVRQNTQPVPPGQANPQKSQVAQQVAPQRFVDATLTPHEAQRQAAGERAHADQSAHALPSRGVAADPRIKSLSDNNDSGQSRSFNPRGNPPDHAVVARPHITGGQGDGTAASIARFLVTPSSEGGAQPLATLDTNPTAAGGAVSGSTAAGAPSIGPTMLQAADLSVTVSDLLTPSESSEPIDSAARILSTSLRGGRHTAVLTLDPPELGQLRLDVHMHKDAMTLRVTADTQAVARLIESRLPELRDALAHHGIQVDRTDVTVRAAPPADQGGHATANPDGQPSTTGGNEFSQGASTSDAGAQEFAAPGDGGADQAAQDTEAPTDADIDGAPADGTLTATGASIDAEARREWVNLVA